MLSEAYAKYSGSIEDGGRPARGRIWPVGWEDFMGPKERVVLLQADKVQVEKLFQAQKSASAKGARKNMVRPWMVRQVM